MRRSLVKYAVVAVILTIPAVTLANWLPTTGFDFRDNHWGNSRAAVKLAESRPPVREDDLLLVYPAKVEGIDCVLVYMFLADRLCAGFYQLSDYRNDNNEYFDDLDGVKDKLVTGLGNPEVENWNWADDPFERSRDLWGDSLGFGLVAVDAGWVTERSIVSYRLSGGNFSGDLLLMYADLQSFDNFRLTYDHYFASKAGDYTPFFRTFGAD